MRDLATYVFSVLMTSHVNVQPLERPSVCFSFTDDNLNINGFSPNLVCALILWKSGLGLLMGKFRQCLTALSA